MSAFSAEWLDLREAADHRSRNAKLAQKLAQCFEGRQAISVTDLGCGTGSNLRATAPLFGPEQNWTLVDYDPSLLDAAVDRLSAWADGADRKDGKLILLKGTKRISVDFRRVNLSSDLEAALGSATDLVTASALFDLVSTEFIARFAEAVAARKAAFYTVLTYDGNQRWTPEHAADADMVEAFHTHQTHDKGFGAAAGPAAANLVGEAFAARGYSVSDGDSAWRVGAGDEALMADLVAGFATAVRETGRVDAATIADWLAVKHTAALVGHTDTLALPPS